MNCSGDSEIVREFLDHEDFDSEVYKEYPGDNEDVVDTLDFDGATEEIQATPLEAIEPSLEKSYEVGEAVLPPSNTSEINENVDNTLDFHGATKEF